MPGNMDTQIRKMKCNATENKKIKETKRNKEKKE
jgi:hypothetical protein